MRNDIYVFFSDREALEDFRDHPDFIAPYQYDAFEYHHSFPEEYGKLRLKNRLNLKLIFNNGRDAKCPWCGNPNPIVKEIRSNSELEYYKRFQAECPTCLARGPTLTIVASILSDKQIEEQYKDMVKERWANRIPKGLKSRIE